MLSVAFENQSSQDLTAMQKSILTLGLGSGIETAVRLAALDNYAFAGLVFGDGTSDTHRAIFQAVYLAPSDNRLYYTLRSGTYTALSSTHFTDGLDVMAGWVHMRLVWVTPTTFRAFWSIDGVTYTDFDEGNITIPGFVPPTYMGVGVSAWGGSGVKLASFEYFRVWTP
jgi:hypothetical protein